MAQKGTYTALQRLTPIKEDFSDNIVQQERLNFRYRQEERDKQNAVIEEQEALNTGLSEDLAALEPVITGVQSVDEINYRSTSAAMNRIGEIYRSFRKDPNLQNDVNLRMELANLKKFPKILKGAEGKITAYAKDLTEGFASGKYSKWDKDKLDELEAFFGIKGKDGRTTPNYIIDFDRQGNMIAKGITKDGRGFTKSINDMVNGYEYSSVTQAIDVDKHTDEIAKNLGKRVESKVGGGFITETQSFDSQEKDLRSTLRASLGSADEPSDLAKSVWADEENMNQEASTFNDSSIKKVEDYIINQVKTKYDESEKKKQLTRQKGSGGKPTSGKGIRLMKDASGRPMRNLGGQVSYEGPKSGYTFSLEKPVSFGVGNKEKKINVLYLSDEGNIVVKGQEKTVKDPNAKSGGINKYTSGEQPKAFEEVLESGSEEINTIARQLGFDDASQLKDHLNTLKPQEDNKAPKDYRKKYNY